MNRMTVLSSSVFLLFLLVNFALGKIPEGQAPREGRSQSDWIKISEAPDSFPVRLVIGLKHNENGLKELDRLFNQVSNPHSIQYGQYLNLDQINDLLAPPKSSVDAVMNWLTLNGIPSSSIFASSNFDFLTIKVNVLAAQNLLNRTIHRYQHKQTKLTGIKIQDDYEIPSSLYDSIDFIGGIMRLTSVKTRITSSSPLVQVTPPYIRSLYNITSLPYDYSVKYGSQATANFLSQFIDPDDLTQFYETFDPSSDASQLSKVQIVGDNTPSDPGVEAELDIQYITAVGGVAVSQTQYRGETDTYQGQEPFLNWLVSLANDTEAPLVNSVSYGDEADTVEAAYVARVDIEFKKAAVRGLTFLIASGDSGVSCVPTGGRFRPEWPTSSPYVVSVGATVTSSTSSSETVASFSGGGFSEVYPLQDWQSDAVSKYLTQNKAVLPPSSYYNASGRAYPDVAALGVNFGVVVGGSSQGVSGTSASTPLFAGVVTLLNYIRLSNGKPPLGFPNPLFYEIASTVANSFFDVTVGNNGACGTKGFPAAKGWDGSTGLGTPNLAVLGQAILNF